MNSMMFMREDGEKIIKFILQKATVFCELCAYIFGRKNKHKRKRLK